MRVTVIARALATAASGLALLAPTANAAATFTMPGTKIRLPASALPHTGSTATPTTPTERTSSTPTPNGAQPGTVAPGATSTPAATSPSTGATGATTGASGATGATGTTGVPPATTPPGLPATLGIVHHPPRKRADKGLSGLALVLAAVGALLVLASLLWAIGRLLALQPRWTGSLVYSLREASYRASATWAEFSDWARIGR